MRVLPVVQSPQVFLCLGTGLIRGKGAIRADRDKRFLCGAAKGGAYKEGQGRFGCPDTEAFELSVEAVVSVVAELR